MGSAAHAQALNEEFRCWICLVDETSTAGTDMIAPCKCIGTSKWVHAACVNDFCVNHLVRNPSRDMRVPCPLCRQPYTFVGAANQARPWRALVPWGHDREFVMRHFRFLLLFAPVAVSVLISLSWLRAHWADVAVNGPGPPLLTGDRLAANISEAGVLEQREYSALGEYVEYARELAMGSADAGTDDAAAPPPPEPHPSGITRKWSTVYVTLQYLQWYKVLAWLLTVVLGGSDGLLPARVREFFQVEELLMASGWRTQVMIMGQAAPFVVSKMRHLFVTWGASSSLVRLLCYSAFSSHVEVACNLCCDAVVSLLLLQDWVATIATDLRLRLSLMDLKAGRLKVADLQEQSKKEE